MTLLPAALLPLLITLFVLFLASSASAADKFRYDVSIRPVPYATTPQGQLSVRGLDVTKTTTVRVLRLGVQQYSGVAPAGQETIGISAGTISAGDQIEVQQPTATVQELYTVPNVTVTGTAGSPTVSGQVPVGTIAATTALDEYCNGYGDDEFPVQVQGGAFSYALPKPLLPGGRIGVTAYPGKGDIVRYDSRIPGESPCIAASSVLYPPEPGDTPSPLPYWITVNGLRATVATGVRVVLRRGATILVDNSNPATTSSLEFEIGQRPQPGDVIDVYRPHTAPTPSKSLTIPSASAVFDPSNSLVAVTAPAALVIRASAGTFFSKFSNSRTAMNTPSGQTRFDFAASDGIDPAYMLTFANYLTAGWTSPDGLNEYYFPVAPGDLTAPSLKIKLASKLKSSKLKSSIPVTVTSSEVASAKLTLTLPAKLKTAKAKSPRVIATGKVTLKAGSKKFKVKLTKSGKKLLKRLRASKAVSQTATLTVVATDASGNVATSVKKTKLASR